MLMLTSIVVAALALTPVQTGDVKLSNARATYGVLGAVRPVEKILPGDFFFVMFDIENLKSDDDGKITYSMGMELINPQGQTEYKKEPQELPPLYNVLGGNRIPAFAHASTNTDTPPGEYTLKVTVIDLATKKPASLSRKFEVLKKDFGVVELTTSYDSQGRFSAPFSGVAGQSLHLNFWVIGFAREKSKGDQPNLTFEMSVIDDASGKPTIPKPVQGSINKDVPPDVPRIPMQFVLQLNRPGKFTVKLKAVDVIGKKTTEMSFPITVTEVK